MSLRTKTWSQLVDTVSAYAGVDVTDRPKELSRLQSLVNQAATELHEFYPYLERWLVVAEPRTVSRSQVESTEDSFYVYGAGTDDVNGLYQRNGTESSFSRYTKYGSNGTDELWDIVNDGAGNWGILVGSDNSQLVEDTVYYLIISGDSTPPTSGWSKNAAAAENPAPLLVDVAEIGLMLHIDRYDIYQDRISQPIQFHTFNDKFPLQTNNPPEIVYCTYQKPLTEEYGDGTGSTTSSLPAEMYNYMVLYAARQMQIAKAQMNANPLYAGVTSKQVQDAFESVGMRQEYQGTIENVARRIQTQFTYDTTLI